MEHVLRYANAHLKLKIANASWWTHNLILRRYHRKRPYSVQVMVNGSQPNKTILKGMWEQFKLIAMKNRQTCVFVFITTDQLCIEKHIPHSISHFSVLTDGVIGGHEYSPLNSQLAASCLITPEIDGLKITNVSELDIDVLRNPKVKAILYFADIESLTEMVLEQQFEDASLRFPVVGGYVTRILSRDVGKLTTFRRRFQYIVVSGPAVKATSVVITDGISTARQIKKKLRKLNEVSERGRRIKFRFAFMLTQNSSPKLSVESVSFREIFPGVPLTGFCHTGQIGMDYPKRRNSTKLNVFQDFSSVFLMVTVYEA